MLRFTYALPCQLFSSSAPDYCDGVGVCKERKEAPGALDQGRQDAVADNGSLRLVVASLLIREDINHSTVCHTWSHFAALVFWHLVPPCVLDDRRGATLERHGPPALTGEAEPHTLTALRRRCVFFIFPAPLVEFRFVPLGFHRI
jgi:hypothetical protein